MWVTYLVVVLLILLHLYLRSNSRNRLIFQLLRELQEKGFGFKVLSNLILHLLHEDGMHLACNLVTFISLRELEMIHGSFSFLGFLVLLMLSTSFLDEIIKFLLHGSTVDYLSLGFSGVNCALEIWASHFIPIGYFFGSPQPRLYDLFGKLILAHLAIENACWIGHLSGLVIGFCSLQIFHSLILF